MSAGLIAVAFGLAYAGGAVLCGLLLPVLWPRKSHKRANALLTLAYRLGLTAVAAGVVAHALGWGAT